FPHATDRRPHSPPAGTHMQGNNAAVAAPQWRDSLLDEYAELRTTLERLMPCLEVSLHLPWIDAIRKLKKQRGALILAHTYQSPEIFHGVADITGDSLALAQVAAD